MGVSRVVVVRTTSVELEATRVEISVKVSAAASKNAVVVVVSDGAAAVAVVLMVVTGPGVKAVDCRKTISLKHSAIKGEGNSLPRSRAELLRSLW